MRSTPTILRKPQGLDEGSPFGRRKGRGGRPRRPTSGPASCARTYRCAITTVLVASLDYPQPPTTGGWMGLPLSKRVFPLSFNGDVRFLLLLLLRLYLFRVASWLLPFQGQGMDFEFSRWSNLLLSSFLPTLGFRGDRNCLIFDWKILCFLLEFSF